jgi:hypothetical protein
LQEGADGYLIGHGQGRYGKLKGLHAFAHLCMSTPT